MKRGVEGDRGKLKRLIRPTLGFQSMRTARATIKGFEVMWMFKKGQFRLWIDAVGSGTEARRAMPYGRATPIVLSEPERAELEGLARRRNAPQGLALRA